VLTTFKAKGLISDHHELGAGVLGRSGTPVASHFMNESDLLVVWGASFSNHTGIAPYKPIVQVDDDPMALGRFHPVQIPVLGDVGMTAQAIADSLPTEIAAVDQRSEIADRWSIWRDEKESRVADDRGRGVGSAALFDALGRHVADDAVVCVDVGNNAYSFGRYFEVERQSVLMSGYLGSIGFALPAALGAWTAVGDRRQIVAVCGDGGFGQYAMEMTTAVRHDMDLTVVLLDNSELGKISKEQRAGAFDVWQTGLVNPDFAEFARSCGALGITVSARAELDAALHEAMVHSGPALVHVHADAALM
jgi:thiamine pyrophosphate-dependent acetolactate synthase large subunit-like protein